MLSVPGMTKRRTKSAIASLAKQNDRLHFKLAQSIGEQILSGVYAPGTLLPNEAEWCRIYGASRTAVREAIKGLNAKGLLVSRPKVGSRVEPRERWNMLDRDVLFWHFSVADKRALLMSIQEVRRVLEPEVAALAALKRTDEQVLKLQQALEDMRAAESAEAEVGPDVRFHLAVLAAANNELLSPFGVLIESALQNLFEYTSVHGHDPDFVIPLHRNIAKAIEQRRPEAARRAVKALLEDTDQILLKGEPVRKRPPKKTAKAKR